MKIVRDFTNDLSQFFIHLQVLRLFLDWFLGYWSKVDTYTGYKYNPGKYEFSDSLMVARNTYRNCDVMSTPYPPLHYLFPLAHVRTAGLFLLIGDNFVMWTIRG